MNQMLKVSSSPHVFKRDTVSSIMGDVLIALLPACVAACYFFGLNSLLCMLVTVAAAVLTEYAINRIRKKPVTVTDLSAAVTGLLLALNMPPDVPLWIPVIGAVFAVAVVKQFFGGLGHNFMNPALAARCVLLICWPGQMTSWLTPGLDAVSCATPLSYLKEGAVTSLPQLSDMFFGNISGCIGETCTLAIAIGCLYLILRKVIKWHIPAVFIGTVFALTTLFAPGGVSPLYGLYSILSGGLFLGACFMATDYSSSPVNTKARLIFACGCGVIMAVIRLFGGYPEGVSFAILLMNLTVPLIERGFKPRVYGGAK